MKTRIAVLISGSRQTALDARAHALFGRLGDRFEITYACHHGNSFGRVREFLNVLRDTRPALIYLMDPIYAAVAATQFYRLTRRVRVILDTGDLVYDLAREMGRINRLGLAIVGWAEETALKMADSVIVRGSYHQQLLRERGYRSVEFVPDGVDLHEFFPMDAKDLRSRLRFAGDDIVVGGVGTMNWSEPRQIVFGWELIEALPFLSDLPVKGLLVGDGDGRARLESRARELCIEEKIIFVGRVPHVELPKYLNAMNICLVTQPNLPAAMVRTTGKLSEYLACDRFVIATQIGTAAQVLPAEMLLSYIEPGRDDGYPSRLAARIRELGRERLCLNGQGIKIAQEYFDYDKLASRLSAVVEQTLD